LGLCPVCRVRVQVPKHREGGVSEEAILNILGKQAPAPHMASVEDTEAIRVLGESGILGRNTPKKCCDRCNQEVPAGTHICPHCHTYIASLSDF